MSRRRKYKLCPACNKRIYSTEAEARGDLAHLLRTTVRKRRDFAMSPYLCGLGYWHFGHSHVALSVDFSKSTYPPLCSKDRRLSC